MRIVEVAKNSLAWRHGLRPDDDLISINGQAIGDAIDLKFHSSDESLDIVWRRTGRIRRRRIHKAPDRDLGLVLEEPRYRRCASKCIFCFVDQMPRGLRPSLYIKDEDYRLSFLHGNYLTLTNFSRKDKKRVLDQRLSPLYISVHATDEKVRGRMLGIGRAPILPLLRELVDGGIRLHCQIVLCPGYNDGPVLRQTIDDLTELAPAVQSIAVVPVGLTIHRKGLPYLRPVSNILARQILEIYKEEQKKLRRRFKRTILYFSDEFYILSGLDIPNSLWYDDYCQLENGVGMARLFLHEFKENSLSLPPKLNKYKKLGIITGKLAKPLLESAVRTLKQIRGLDIELIGVENRLFGPRITVSGLLGSQDILRAIEGASACHWYALPKNVINPDGLFIDGLSQQQFCGRLAPAGVSFGLDELFRRLRSWAG